MLIRRAQDQDIPGIHKLLAEVNRIHHEGRPDLFNLGNKYTDDELRAIIADDARPIFVAVDEGAPTGQVLGYAFCVFEQIVGDNIRTPVRTLYIDDLCVDADSRGQHVGESLYRHVVDFARENGFHNVTLHVWELNQNAKGFYEHLGMRPLQTTMEEVL